MRRTKALRRMLCGMTETFNEGEQLDVEFDDGCYADIDGEYVAVAPNVKNFLGRDLSGPEELRVIVDSLSHEVEHIRETDLAAKKDIMDYYEVTYRDGYNERDLPLGRKWDYATQEAKIAGNVYNILEDQYIDWHRTERFRGLRKSHAFFVQTQMDGRRLSKIAGKPVSEQLVSGLFQVAIAGYAKGVKEMAEDNPEDDVLQFLAWVRPHVEECRYEHDHDERVAIAKRVTDALIDRIPEDDGGDLADFLDKLPIEGDADVDGQEGGEYDVGGAEADSDLPESPEDAEQTGSSGGEGEGEGEGDADGEDSPKAEYGDVPDDAEEYDGDAEIDHESLAEEADDDGVLTVEEGDESDDTEQSGSGGSGIGNDNPGISTEDVDDFEADKDNRTGGEEGEFDFDNAVDAMTEAEDTDAAKEWAGLAEDVSLGVSDADQRKYEQIREQVEDGQTDMGKAKRERDERAGDMENSNAYKFVNSETVRDYMNQTGLANEVRRAFRKLATQDDEFASSEGHAINVRNAVEHMAGNYGQDELYVDEHQAAHGGRLVGATVDMSGSMGAYEKEAKAALGALNLATHEIGDEFCANTFFSFSDKAHNEKPKTKLITAPDESFEWDHLNSFTSEALDPLAKGVKDLTSMMDKHQARQKVVFVIADGKPNLTSDGFNNSVSAVKESKQSVQDARADGYVVIGLGIGNVSKQNMKNIFGTPGDDEAGYIMADSVSLAEELVETYKKQLGVEEVEY